MNGVQIMAVKTAAKKAAAFFKAETVLCAAVILAAASAFFVKPDREYLNYIDFNTLFLLFALMAVMKGLQNAGIFIFLGRGLMKKASGIKAVELILVFLPFFFSMIITNDVALITFVPFSLVVLKMANLERLAVKITVLQTLAANLGSMLLPMGNPQNLYLYAKSGYGFGRFCLIMLPYVIFSGICLLALSLIGRSRGEIGVILPEQKSPDLKVLIWCVPAFLICLASVFKLVSAAVPAVIIAVFLVFYDRKVLKQVDYSLLGTFAAFFIFVGNIGRIEVFKNALSQILSVSTQTVASAASQVISNVPAALLLSGFSDDWKGLIVGCNIGGLGTLIASMASLISYKLLLKEFPSLKKKYLILFTVLNFAMLALLLALSLAL